MPEDHSELVPLLPIPNRTVKRLSADDSADTRVKVGHSQAIKSEKARSYDRAFFCVFFSDAPANELDHRGRAAHVYRLVSLGRLPNLGMKAR